MSKRENNNGVQRRFRFTHQLLTDLAPQDAEAAAREAEYSDTEIVGLKLLVSKTGRKFFYQRFTLDGRKGAVRIGEFPSVSLKDARAAAHGVKAALARGEDPRADRNGHSGSPLLADFSAEYLAHARQHKRSWRDDEIRLDKEILPRFGRKRLAEVTARDVQAMASHLRATRAPATCNRYLALLQRVYSYANEVGAADVNPARQVKKYREDNARERYLSKDEVGRFLAALDGLENQSVAAGLRFLLFSGLRKMEAFGLAWKNVDRAEGTVRLTHTKSGKPRTVFLNALARGVIDERWEAREGDHPYVFPGRCKGQAVVNPQKPFAAACRQAGIEGLRIHDLRHSFASLAINSGASLYDVSKLLGHATTQMTQRYAHLEDASIRRATEQVAVQIGLTGTDG